MTISNAVHVASGLFLTGIGSLMMLAFGSLALGVHAGFLVVCCVLLITGLAGTIRSQYKGFFAGWLLWTAILVGYIGIALF